MCYFDGGFGGIMILVIGGNNQGKKDYAKTLFPDAEIWDKLHLYIKEQLEKGLSEEEIFFEIVFLKFCRHLIVHPYRKLITLFIIQSRSDLSIDLLKID